MPFSDAHYTFTPGNTNETVALILNEIYCSFRKYYSAELSEKYSYTPTYLSELLRQRCGKTFSELVLEQKEVELRAKALLIHTKLPVSLFLWLAMVEQQSFMETQDPFLLHHVKWEAETFSHGPRLLDKSHFLQVLPIDIVLWEIELTSCRSSGNVICYHDILARKGAQTERAKSVKLAW